MGLPQRDNYADRLRAQARALQRRAFDLIREAEGLKAEAVELFTDADLLDNTHVHVTVGGRVQVPEPTPITRTVTAPTPVAKPPAPDHGAIFAERVCTILRNVGAGMTVGQVAECIGAPKIRVKAVLDRLEADGAIYRTGKTRATRYHVTEDEPVRTGTATLHVFTKQTKPRELEDRRVAWSTEAPVPVGALPAVDDDS